MQKRVVSIILLSIILTIILSSCNSKQNSKPMLSEDWMKFSAYSSNKELRIYGEISVTEFKKGKEFTINTHIKNMTDNKYIISSEGKPVNVWFYKIGSNFAIAGSGHIQTIEPKGSIDEKLTIKPRKSGEHMLNINSDFSIAIEFDKNIGKFNKIFLRKKIHVK